MLISIVAVELTLRYLIIKTNLPRVYHDVAEYNLSDEEGEGKREYSRDLSMEVYGGDSNLEVLCIGDSFTNGGNTFWDNSYPYKLFLRFDKKITVRNLGVCSSTTEQIADRLKDFFESNQFSRNKHYVIAVMAGSADVFAGKNLIQSIPALNISKDQKWVEMSQQMAAPDTASIFTNFYTYKMVVLLVRDIGNRLHATQNNYLAQVAFSSNGLENCRSIKDRLERASCLRQALTSESYQNVSQNIKEYLIIRFLMEKKTFKSSEVTSTIRDFMTFVKQEPRLLERDYLVMNLLGFIKLQDIISFQELASFIQNQSQSLSPKAQEVNSLLIKNSQYWYDNVALLNRSRDVYWEKIYQLARSHNSEVIVMNYPLPYKTTNNYLGTISTQKNLEFIDIEKKFTSAAEGTPELIDDWEHCSPEGYDLIAETLYEKIQKMNGNSTVKNRN